MLFTLNLNTNELCKIIELRLGAGLVEHNLVPELIAVYIEEAGKSFVVNWRVSMWREVMHGLVVVNENKLHYGNGMYLFGRDFDGNWDTVSQIVCEEAVSKVRQREVALWG